MAPLVMLTGESGSTWADHRNRVLAMGLTQYEATVCGGCGLSLVDTTHADVRIEADSRHCRGCELLDSARGEADKPGTQYYLDVTSGVNLSG